MPDKSDYETGACKFPAKQDADASDDFSQDAAGNERPAGGMGLTQPIEEVNEKTHQSDGSNSTNGEDIRRSPAVAEHSKDAKTQKAGNPEPASRSELG